MYSILIRSRYCTIATDTASGPHLHASPELASRRLHKTPVNSGPLETSGLRGRRNAIKLDSRRCRRRCVRMDNVPLRASARDVSGLAVWCDLARFFTCLAFEECTPVLSLTHLVHFTQTLHYFTKPALLTSLSFHMAIGLHPLPQEPVASQAS